MKFFEEQRQNIADKISKKILKDKNQNEKDTEINLQVESSQFFYELEGRERQFPQRGGRGGDNQRIHHQFNRRRPNRRGRGDFRNQQIQREPAVARAEEQEDLRPEAAREVREDTEDISNVEEREDRDGIEEREERVERRERVEQQDQRDDRLNQRRIQGNFDRNRLQDEREGRDELGREEQLQNNQQNEDIREEEVSNSAQKDQKEDKDDIIEEESLIDLKEEAKGIQFQLYKVMVLNLFEVLQSQESYLQIEDQSLEIEDNLSLNENNQIVKNALEVSLLLEAYRRNIVNEVIEILVFLKNYQQITVILQSLLQQNELKDTINKVIDENNLILQDLLIFYAFYQIFKENTTDEQKKLFIRQEEIFKQKLNFILNLHKSNTYNNDPTFTTFFDQLSQFQESNNKDTNKSYQIIATFVSVYSNNIEGIQVKNTDLFLQNVFTSQSWKLSQQSIKKLFNQIERRSEYSQKLASQEGSVVFNLQSKIQHDEGIISVDCLNQLSLNFLSDSSIFTEVQIRNLKKYTMKEQSRISAKQQKSISEYIDEEYKIKFFFSDGLFLKSLISQDEFICVDVKNLPPNLRDQDLQEVLDFNLSDVSSINQKYDSQKQFYYEITFKDKQLAKDFMNSMNMQQIMYQDQYVIVTPHFIPELQSISNHYSINLQIGRNREVQFIVGQIRNQEYYKKVKKQQMFEQIEKFLKYKSNLNLQNLSFLKRKNLYEIQNIIETLKQEKVEEIFDVKLSIQSCYTTSINVQKNIYDFFQERFQEIRDFKSNHVSVSCEEYYKNNKEIQITISSPNQNYLKKTVKMLSKAIRPIRYIPLQSNKEKEVFFRADFMKNLRKKYTKNYFYTYFNTINMSFEFYTENQFNFTFFNNNNSEAFIQYYIGEREIQNVEKLMKQFKSSLYSFEVKSSYYIHPSLQQDFIQYINQMGITKYSQNDKVFELELQLQIYMDVNKKIQNQFVKASYLKKNQEIYNNKKAIKMKNNENTEMQSCIVCYDSDHIFSLTNCSCRSYCRDCLREQIQIEIQNNYVSFSGIIKCPLCREAPISLKDLSKLFNLYEIQSMVSQWVKCITYNSKNSDGQKLFAHCIYPKCQGIILIPSNLKVKSKNESMEIESEKQEEQQNEVTSIICGQCNNALCSQSLIDNALPFHSAHPSSIQCMDHFLQQREEMPSNTKYCPSCSQIYFHESGCNHLTCYQCGEHFCSICSKGFGKVQGTIYTHIQECEQKKAQEQPQAVAQEQVEQQNDWVEVAQPANELGEAAQPANEWGEHAVELDAQQPQNQTEWTAN